MPLPFEDCKPYTKEELTDFLDFIFLKYFSKDLLSRSKDIQFIYRDFNIIPLSERMLETLGKLEKKGKKTNDKS